MAAERIDVDALIDGQKLGVFNFGLIFWSFLALFADGFEIAALGLAAPHFVREWGVEPGAMGPMMSASLFGVLVGAPLFGFIGDRMGRRIACVWSCVIFGVFTLAVVAAQNVEQVTLLRFLTGIGMGGLLPNVIALNSEMAPKRLRARLVILVFLGITLGGAAPGFVAAALVEEHGWRTLFWVGGVVPLLTAIGLVVFLAESVKFLALQPRRKPELVRTLRRMRPDVTIADTAEVAPAREDAQPNEGALVGPIFAGGMAALTFMVWIAFSTTLMANYFLNSWMPMLFEQKGIDAQSTALITSMYHVGAILGGLVMSLVFDRWGALAIAAMLAAAAPAMLLLGLPNTSVAMHGAFVTLAGFSVLGAQFGNNAASGLIYPTAYRSKGVGLAVSVGRIGSILGPMIGAALIAANAPLATLLSVVAATLAAGAVAALALAWLSAKRFGSLRLSETPAEAATTS